MSNPKIQLHPRQTAAFSSLATEILYGGAAGGGKSFLLRAAFITWCSLIDGLQAYIFRRVSDDLVKNHMEGPSGFPAMLSEWCDEGYVRINYSKGTISFWNGSKIFLCHCQYEKDMYKYQGAEIHLLGIDELTHFTPQIYKYLRGRVRLGALRVPKAYKQLFPRILCGSNPGGLGHNWVKAAFVDNATPMEIVQMSQEEGGMLRQYIPAKLSDNPTLMETDPFYEHRLEGLGNPALVRAMRDGDWNIVSGGALDDVWRNEVHILKPFDIPKTWRIDRSFDWGSSHPFAVCWWAESDGSEVIMRDGIKLNFPRGTLFLVAELYGWNGNPDEGCKKLAVEVARDIIAVERKVFMGRNVLAGQADNSIFDAQNGVCIADDMARAGVRWERSDKSAGSRKTGLEAVRRRMKACLEHPMEDAGIFVFDTCRHFLRTVPIIPRDIRDPDDVDTKSEDHIFDAVRYRVLSVKKSVTAAHYSGMRL